MPSVRPAPSRPRRQSTRRVSFNRTKYGRDLLVDVAFVHDMPAFILDAPHSLEFFDIMLVTRGRGTFTLDGVRHAVRPGRVLFSSPGRTRRWDVDGLDGICLFFVQGFVGEFLQDAAFLQSLPFFQAEPGCAALQLAREASRRLRARLKAMHGELAHFRRDSVHLLRAQLHETLLLLARDYSAAYGVAATRATHGTVARFVALVERDIAARHRVASYASELGVSPGHLTTLCARFLGTTAKGYIAATLATRARRLLLYSDDSAARIGSTLGFADPSYFTRFFRRESGRSPTAFRAEHRDR